LNEAPHLAVLHPSLRVRSFCHLNPGSRGSSLRRHVITQYGSITPVDCHHTNPSRSLWNDQAQARCVFHSAVDRLV